MPAWLRPLVLFLFFRLVAQKSGTRNKVVRLVFYCNLQYRCSGRSILDSRFVPAVTLFCRSVVSYARTPKAAASHTC